MGLGVMKIPQTPVINTTINPDWHFQSRTSFIVLPRMLLPLRGWRISGSEVDGGVDGFGYGKQPQTLETNKSIQQSTWNKAFKRI